MARLNPKQREEIRKRLLAGEKVAPLAREFNVSATAIRNYANSEVSEIKTVANQLFEAEVALAKLPKTLQIETLDLLSELRSVSTHLASAAKYGAMTAHRLSGLAHQHASNLDDVDPDGEKLSTVARLTAVANESAKTGLNLLAANKDKQIADQPTKPRRTLKDFYAAES
jgi:hypothetical protein